MERRSAAVPLRATHAQVASWTDVNALNMGQKRRTCPFFQRRNLRSDEAESLGPISRNTSGILRKLFVSARITTQCVLLRRNVRLK